MGQTNKCYVCEEKDATCVGLCDGCLSMSAELESEAIHEGWSNGTEDKV